MTDTIPKIPVILCVDVEPDPRRVNRSEPEPWTGYEFTFRYLSELRPRIEESTGSAVRYNWFFRMDPQITESYGSPTWAIDRYPAFAEDMIGRGDEVGIHAHEWRWIEEERVWMHDFRDQKWIDHCVGTSLEAFAQAMGRACTSFRFGDRWMNDATVNFLEQHGVLFDLTIEPGAPPMNYPAEEPARGRLPDYFRVPRIPYEPSRHDFRNPAPTGSRRLRMIPLTSSYLRLGFRPRSHLRRLRKNGLRNYRQSTPLYMWKPWRPPNGFEQMLSRSLDAQADPYLAFAIRSDLTRSDRFEPVKAALHALLAHPRCREFEFCTPDAATAMLGARS